MTGGWTLLRNRDEFRSYQERVVRDNNMFATHIRWGDEPPVYPCLVASRLIGPTQVVACYCLPADARELLAALPGSVPAALPVPSHAAVAAPAAVSPSLTERQNFDRQISALLLAIVHTMCETRLTSEERFDRDYSHFLALVDQDVSLRKDLALKTVFEARQYKAIMEEEDEARKDNSPDSGG